MEKFNRLTYSVIIFIASISLMFLSLGFITSSNVKAASPATLTIEYSLSGTAFPYNEDFMKTGILVQVLDSTGNIVENNIISLNDSIDFSLNTDTQYYLKVVTPAYLKIQIIRYFNTNPVTFNTNLVSFSLSSTTESLSIELAYVLQETWFNDNVII